MKTRKRPRRVTAAHRRDMLHLLSFGALTFRGLCVLYAGESSGPVDRGLVRATLDSLVGRGEVVSIKMRRPPQHPVSPKPRARNSKHERKPVTVYAVAGGAVMLPGWAAGAPSRVSIEDHLLALLVVSADAAKVGRTTLVCSSDEQAARVFAEAKRMLSVESWGTPR